MEQTPYGYLLSEKYFPSSISKSDKLISDFKNKLDIMAENDPTSKDDRIYRAFYEHYRTDFKNLRIPLRDFPDALKSGEFFQKNTKETKKEESDVQLTFSF